MKMPFQHIAIVGLGLMGGSCAYALKAQHPHLSLYAVSRDMRKIRYAIQHKIIDKGCSSLKELLAQYPIEVIIIATPVSLIAPYIAKIEQYAHHTVIVTDVGSTKEEIVSAVSRMSLKKAIYVGSHPMAGSHESGLAAAHKHLYQNSLCYVISNKKHTGAVKKIKSLWKSMGSTPYEITARKHDELVSTMSHLPHALAMLLATYALGRKKGCEPFAGSGFLDTTRIAQSDAQMWHDIFLSNRAFLMRDLMNFQKEISYLLKILSQKQSKKLFAFLHKSHRLRKTLAQQKGIS